MKKLFASRLFWKFFISILLAQIAATLAIGGAFWIKNREYEKNFERNNSKLIEIGPRAEDAINAAAAILQYGGTLALQNYLAQVQHHKVYVIDDEDRDLLNRKVPKSAVAQARQVLETNTESNSANSNNAANSVRFVKIGTQQFLLFLPNFKDANISANDSYASLLSAKALRNFSPAPPRMRPPNGQESGIEPPRQPPSEIGKGPPPRDFALTPIIVIAAAVIASLLFAALLAWYFARPIVALRLAFAAASDGDLSPRFMRHSHYGNRDELNDLGNDFDLMSQQIKAMMERQTKLLHDVSHELRSPLARLQAAIGLAHQQPERIALHLERMERESARMDTLVGELLTLARLEAGAYKTVNESIDFVEFLEELISDASFEAGLQQSQISLQNLSNKHIFVHGQAELLSRAFENILRNAIKYSPPQSHITICLNNDEAEENLIIDIMDQGDGVPEEELDRIFLAFYRSTRNAQQIPGHGLGLAIARQVVLSHGGTISATNLIKQQVDKTSKHRNSSGLCIRIQLPIKSLPKLKASIS